MRNQHIAAILAICWHQVISLKAVEIPQDSFQFRAIRENHSTVISDVPRDASVVGNWVMLSVKMAPPSGQLASKMVEPSDLLPLGGKAVGGDDGNSRANKSASKERKNDGNPIYGGDGFWHNCKLVLMMWGAALLMNAVAWPIAMWCGGYWHNIEDHSQIVRFVSSFIADTLTGISRAEEKKKRCPA